ncbi:MAG: ferritin-like domain-containing protein [Chloroflexota bacterium]|nr:ferritin-like domain-containing protein [Chloroflexota bacterium]
MSKLSRRAFLKGSAIAGGAALVGFNSVFGFSRVLGQEMADDDLQTILNLAATAELFASTHYLAAINGDLGLGEAQVNYLKAGLLAEWDHYQLLVSLGAEPVVTEFYVPETLFSDVALFATITEVAETAFVGAYLAATRIFSKSEETTPFAVTTAQIAAVEAEHRALVRQIGGLLPNNTSYAQYTLFNVSSAVPVLQPFLDGSGEGFIGPVAAATAADFDMINAEAEMIGYDRPGVPFAAMDEMPM